MCVPAIATPLTSTGDYVLCKYENGSQNVRESVVREAASLEADKDGGRNDSPSRARADTSTGANGDG